MIPELTREGLLPPGIHEATLGEVRRRFGGSNQVRLSLMKGLSEVVVRAKRAGAKYMLVDGSFVTDKKDPGDWDAVLVFPVECNAASEDAVLLTDRERIRKDHGGDLFTITEDDQEVLEHFVKDVFGTDREKRPKGLLCLRLKGKEDERGTDQE
jgi:hypothetical protein